MSNKKKPTEYSMTPAAIAQREFLKQNAGKLPPDDPRHGKASTYNRFRCKCEKCTAAWREKCKEMKDARLAMTKDENDPRHGTPNFYGNYGCRCERCTLAWREVGTPRQKARRDKIAKEAAVATGKTSPKKAAVKSVKASAKPVPSVEAPVAQVSSEPVAGESPVFLEADAQAVEQAVEQALAPVKVPANPWGAVVEPPAPAPAVANPWGAKLS